MSAVPLAAPPRPWYATAVAACRPSEVLREHAPLMIVMLAYVAAAALCSQALGRGAEFRHLWAFYTTLFNLLLAACVAVTLAGCWALRRASGGRVLAGESLLRACAVHERFVVGLPLVILLPAFLTSMTAMKLAIPAVNPYHWDAALAHWDAALHGGRQPWEWLQPFLGHRPVTWAINLFYHSGYFLGIYLVLFWQVFELRQRRLRMQFLLSFMLAWILLGSVAATALSSVGPCYYGDFVAGHDPYAPLMEYLRGAKAGTALPWVTDIQRYLLDAHRSNAALGGVGISAMPSLHVSITFLFALLGWRSGRAPRLVFSLLAAVTLVGSVHLGWHYALDGYVSIAGTWLIWRAVGAWLDRREQSLGERRMAIGRAAPVLMPGAAAQETT